MRKSIWGRRTFLVVTGASQGIGRKLAIEFSQLLENNSIVLLLARSSPNLEETKAQILSVKPNINVEVQSIDLSKPNEQAYSDILMNASRNIPYDIYLLVHNAGSIVVDTPASRMVDADRWNDYMTVNLYSATMLTSLFLNLFKEGEHCIVNISSLCAQKPFRGLAMYCAAKASRELYFKVLAEENPSINILNYSPGPIETDMYREIANRCCFPDMIEQFKNLKNTNSLVKVEDTIAKLVSLLKEQLYENGATIDYYGR